MRLSTEVTDLSRSITPEPAQGLAGREAHVAVDVGHTALAAAWASVTGSRSQVSASPSASRGSGGGPVPRKSVRCQEPLNLDRQLVSSALVHGEELECTGCVTDRDRQRAVESLDLEHPGRPCIPAR